MNRIDFKKLLRCCRVDYLSGIRRNRMCLLFLLGFAWPLAAEAVKETKPSISQASSIPSVTAWFIGDINYPPSGNPALFDGYPTAMAACEVAGKTYMDMLIHMPHLFPYQISLGSIYDSQGGTADYFFQCLVTYAGNSPRGQVNQTWVHQKCPAGYTLNGANSPNRNPYLSLSNTTTTLECISPVSCPAVPAGEPLFMLDPGGKTCSREISEIYTLSLTPDTATIEPDKTYTFTATVTKQGGGAPSQDVPVSVKVEVDPTSGGHDHGDKFAKRDKGSVSPATGNKVLSFKFTAAPVSGKHTITATCEQCVNKTATSEVKVMVEGLEPIPGSSFYTMTESNGSGGTKVIGATDNHSDNHYLTPAAATVLWSIAASYQMEAKFWQIKKRKKGKSSIDIPPPILHLNDASLKWGGVFDISGKWKPAHEEHRRGTVIDVRANADPNGKPNSGAVPPGDFAEFEKNGLSFGSADAQIHCNRSDGQKRKKPLCTGADGSQDSNRHYHIRLLGVEE